MDIRLPGAATHSSRFFLRFVGADNIPISTPAGVHDGAAVYHKREVDGPLLPRVVRLRLSHWAIG